MKKLLDAIVCSDIHLGSDVCQAKSFCHFLELIESEQIATRELILNGDVFDSWDFRRLKKSHWKVLSLLRKLSDNIKITWINGNHDGPTEVVSHLLGTDVTEEYGFQSGNKNILALHGHIFDKFITDHKILTYFADCVYGVIQKIDPSFYLAKWAKKSSKTFLRCSELIEERAIEYAQKNDYDIVLCGHSHLEISHPEKGYYNSGCWTEIPCSYLTILDGVVNLEHYDENYHSHRHLDNPN